MQDLQRLLDEYAESHTHAGNKLIHWICVPLIVWSLIALLWSVPFPNSVQIRSVPLNWALLAVVCAQFYYFRLSPRLGTGVLLFNLLLLWLTAMLDLLAPLPLWQLALGIFVLSWTGQFIGHYLEGKRPSFYADLQFLLVGPAWLMSHVYRLLGLRYG